MEENVVKEERGFNEMPQEPNGNNKKGSKLFTIALLVIIVLLIAIIVILLLGGNNKNGDNSGNSEENTENIENTEVDPEPDHSNNGNNTEKLTDNEISNVMDRFKSIKIESERLFGNDKFNISNIDNNELLVTVLSKFDIYNACSHEGKDVLLLSEINEELNKYVKKSLTIDDIKALDRASMGNPYDYDYGITVQDNEKIKIINSVCGSEFGMKDYVYSHIINGVKDGDYVYIYEKEAFAKYNGVDENNHFLVDYYKDYKKTGAVVEKLKSKEFTDGYGNPIEGSTPNWDLYNTYKYTFKLIDGEYYFQTFELDK